MRFAVVVTSPADEWHHRERGAATCRLRRAKASFSIRFDGCRRTARGLVHVFLHDDGHLVVGACPQSLSREKKVPGLNESLPAPGYER
jgi:hypothetical protein